jgi:hypothetical protein
VGAWTPQRPRAVRVLSSNPQVHDGERHWEEPVLSQPDPPWDSPVMTKSSVPLMPTSVPTSAGKWGLWTMGNVPPGV